MKAIITGAEGFVGKHLQNRLSKQNSLIVIPWSRKEVDLRNTEKVYELINNIRPDYIFHLAGSAYVPFSFSQPWYALENNIKSTLNIFEAVKNAGINPVIQIACTSEEYGFVEEKEIPIKETVPLKPLSPYGVSKAAMDNLGWQYQRSYGLRIIRTRAFNHTGYGRGEMYAESNFAKQLILIKKGLKPPVLKVGNLDAIRDYTDVEDIVEAYWRSTDCPPDVYNIASGIGYTIKEILNKLIEIIGKKVEIKKEYSRIRVSDVPILIGDSTKFREITNWKPKISIRKTLTNLLNYWEEKL